MQLSSCRAYPPDKCSSQLLEWARRKEGKLPGRNVWLPGGRVQIQNGWICWCDLGKGEGTSLTGYLQEFLFSLQQQQLQHLSHHVPPIPLTPHPSGSQTSGLASVSTTSGLLALSSVLAAHTQLALKDDRGPQDSENNQGRRRMQGKGCV